MSRGIVYKHRRIGCNYISEQAENEGSQTISRGQVFIKEENQPH